MITDKLGQIKSRRDFMPFGEDLAPDANYRTAGLKYSTTDEVRQKFTGYQKDTETGLDFAEARMYNNQHGRFTAVDPLLTSSSMMVPQTWNRYVYVGNNPINITDPTGEKWAIREYEKNGSPMVSFIWYDQKLTDEQVAEGWTDYDYKTNRFYVSDNYVWYLARDQQDFVMVNRLVFDFVNGEGSFASLHGGPSGEFTQETKKKIMDAVLFTLMKENRDPVQRLQKEMGEQIALSAGAAAGRLGPKSTNLPVNRIKLGYLSGSLDGLKQAEKNVVSDLLYKGKNVTIVPRSSSPTPDFLVNGVSTELKTINTVGPNTFKNAIQKATKQGNQILIDARGVKVTEEYVREQFNRVAGNGYDIKGMGYCLVIWQ